MTDSRIAWMEFIISNPKTAKEERNAALDLLIASLIQEAQKLNYKFIWTTTNNPKLEHRYELSGFVVSDKNVNNMIRRL